MLESKGFDLWADGYDASVNLSEEDDSYPFAGYSRVLGEIYRAIREKGGKRVLDIGFGTGMLAGKLYADGYEITGVDFSRRMIEIAREKMPGAKLICHDFSQGLPGALAEETFDAIVCTYAIHHLTDGAKVEFLRELLERLAPGGRIYIGDVAFETRTELEECRRGSGDEWDEDEIYIVAREIMESIPKAGFRKISHCAGILEIGYT